MARKMPRRLFVQPHTSIDTGKQEMGGWRDVLSPYLVKIRSD